MKKIVQVVLTVLTVSAFAQNEVGEISRYDYSPTASSVIETYISGNNGTSYYRLSLCENTEITRIKAIGSYDYTVNMIKYTESFREQKLMGGLYIVVLESFPDVPFRETNSFKYISSIISKDTGSIYAKVDSYDEEDVITSFKSKTPYSYGNYQISFTSGNGSVIHPYYKDLNNANYTDKVDKYSRFLKSKGFQCEGFAYCYNTTTKKVFLASLIRFGVKGTSYAMYGIWESDEANKYGFKKGQRIYMSEGIKLAERTFAQRFKINFSSDAAYKRTSDNGELHYTYDYIVAHKRETYPNLSWRTIPLNSRSPKTLDEEGGVIPDKYGYIPPNYPDNKNNTNPPGLTDCPDMDWYWSLFCDCAEKKFGMQEEIKVTSTMYQSFNDYAEISMMEKQYDPTIYGTDHSVAPLKVDVDAEPVQPYLYTKDLALINKDFPQYYDPFDPKTTYSLQYRKTEMNWFKIETHTHNRDVKGLVTPAFNKVTEFYQYVNNVDNLSDVLKNYTDANKIDNNGSGVWYSIQEGKENLALYLANKADKNARYRDARTFLIQDNHYAQDGKPFKCESHSKDWYKGKLNIDINNMIENQNDDKRWYLLWTWPIMYEDKYGIKHQVGEVNYRIHFWDENDKLLPEGKEIDGVKRNRFLVLGGNQVPSEQVAGYDSVSKDYYADQYDVGDRDSSIEKSEAIKEIVFKIAVSEGLDLVMKGLNYLGKKNNYFKPVYEGAKRLENSFTQSKSYKLAKEVYKGYVFWKRCMDVAADLRDSYNSISQAWDGLLYGVENTWNYYKDMNWSKLRFSNCTMLLPSSKLDRIDASFQSLQLALQNTSVALYGCAFQADQLTRGNYGPFNPVVKAMTTELTSSIQTINDQTTGVIDRNTKQLDDLTRKSGSGVSDQAYLSNVIASANCLMSSQRLKLQNEKVRGLGVALYITEAESRDWISYNNYWVNIGNNAKRVNAKANNDKSLMPIASLLRTEGLFSSPRLNKLENIGK